MANNQQPNKTQAGNYAQQARQQNAQGGQAGAGQFGTEFASETNAHEARRQNQQAQQNKNQNS